MTDISFHYRPDATTRALSLERLRVYLVSRQERRKAIENVQRLNERALRDTGIDSQDVAGRVDAELTRLGLRDLGSRGLR
jgi:hypothetical protein